LLHSQRRPFRAFDAQVSTPYHIAHLRGGKVELVRLLRLQASAS
jgi:hypothetical protein